MTKDPKRMTPEELDEIEERRTGPLSHPTVKCLCIALRQAWAERDAVLETTDRLIAALVTIRDDKHPDYSFGRVCSGEGDYGSCDCQRYAAEAIRARIPHTAAKEPP